MNTKSNAPPEYICPICEGLNNPDSDKTLIKKTDLVYRDEFTTVLINSFFMGRNVGHVIVVPNLHYENIFDIPDDIAMHVFKISKICSHALKDSYQADGITIRQNNQPAGDQHAFHFHLHVFPRYIDDGFNQIQPEQKRLASPDERRKYAIQLSNFIKSNLTIKAIAK